jgi:hypothetical protein
MATLTMIAGVALTALSVGILAGVLLWRRYMGKQIPAPQRTLASPVPLLWDIHSLLNAMNRFAVAAERGSAIDPAVIYNLSDYLLHSSLLQREGGWAEKQTLDNWLQAHLRILAELKAHGNIPRIGLKFSERIRRIEANQLIRQLHWFLQRTHAIDSIDIQATPHVHDHTATVTVVISGRMDELDGVPMEDLKSIWRLDQGKCSCELQTDCELRTAAEASSA